MTFINVIFASFTALYFISDPTHSSNALVLQSEQPRIEPSESCLDCICQAISSCNHSVGCTGGACGMFRITQDYWIDSDRPVPKGMNSDNNVYEKCANDPKCARQSATNYLTKFAQDCNRDGTIDCGDYAAIHMQGGYGCGDLLDGKYKSVYEDCMYSTLVDEVFTKDVSPSTVKNRNDNIVFPDS